jgi:hypothetical protein
VRSSAVSHAVADLFNGDIVDRGAASLECLLFILAAMVALPTHVHVLRGNQCVRPPLAIASHTFHHWREPRAW